MTTLTSQHADLASIDAEIEAERLAALDVTVRDSEEAMPGVGEDQASRLRALLGVERSETRHVAPRPEPRDESFRPAEEPRIDRCHHARVITIASGKGGVGKTNVAVNLSIALARRGLRVTLLDADLGTANADVLCGIRPAARLDHVLAPGGLAWQDGGRRTISEIAVEAPGGFRLVPGAAGISRMADLSASDQRVLIRALRELELDADVLIVDAAAGVGRAVTCFLEASDLALIVTTPEPTALADAYALAKCAYLGDETQPRRTDSDRLALIVNQARDPLEGFAVHARFNKVCERFLGASVPILGFIAQDLLVAEAVRAQRPLLVRSPQSPAALNICDLADAAINRLGVRASRMEGGVTGTPARGISRLVRRLLGFSSEVA